MRHNIKQYLLCMISLLIMFFFRYLPSPGYITNQGMEIIGLLLGAVFAYCTVGMIWPSIIVLILLGLSDGYTVSSVFRDAFGHPIVLYMLFLSIMGGIIDNSGLAGYFAQWIISRKAAQGRPWLLTSLLLFAAFFCGLFLGMIAATIICWAIVENIFEKAGYKKGDKWPAVILYGILFVSTVSSNVLPFQMGVVANYGILKQASGGILTYNYLSYLTFSIIYSGLVFVAYLLVAKYILKPDVKALTRKDLVVASGSHMDKRQKAALLLFVFFLIGLLLPSFLPNGVLIRQVLDNIGPTGWTAVIIAIGILIRVDGSPFVDFGQMVSKGVIWEVIFVMAAIFQLSGAVVAKGTGVQLFFTKTLLPAVNGFGTLPFIIITLILVTLAANIINNLVVCTVSIPIIYILSEGSNINVVAIVALLIFVANACFLFPASSPQASMIYQNEQWVNAGQVRALAIYSIVIMILLAIIIGIPLSFMVF